MAKESTVKATEEVNDVEETQDENIGTTRTLFAEAFEGQPIRDENGLIIEHNPLWEDRSGRPKAEETKEVKTETVKPANSDQTVAKVEPTEGYLSDLNVKVKTKVAGKEGEVTVAEALRNYQTWEYLTQKGQELAELKRDLERKERELSTKKPDSTDYGFVDTAEPESKTAKEIADLKRMVAQMTPILGSVKYREDVKRLAGELATEGYDDFMEFLPTIESHVASLPIEQQEDARTAEFYTQMYLKEKLKALSSGKQTDTVTTDNRPVPKLTRVESSSTPSTINEDAVSRRKLFEQAKKSGDWATFFNKTGLDRFGA